MTTHAECTLAAVRILAAFAGVSDEARLVTGDELTLERIEMDALVHQQYPCSTGYYAAQVELNRQRFEHSRN